MQLALLAWIPCGALPKATRAVRGERKMRNFLVFGALGLAFASTNAQAQPVDLSAYADANGFIDVQTLTCGQLANTYQQDADMLTTWYSELV